MQEQEYNEPLVFVLLPTAQCNFLVTRCIGRMHILVLIVYKNAFFGETKSTRSGNSLQKSLRDILAVDSLYQHGAGLGDSWAPFHLNICVILASV